MTYPVAFREKVLSVRKRENLTIEEIAVRFDVGKASVSRWIKTPLPKYTRNKPAVKLDREALAKEMTEHPDSYLYERAERFAVSVSGISAALKRLGISRKKKSATSQSG